MVSDPPPSGVEPSQWATIAAQARTLGADPGRTLHPRMQSLGSTDRGILSSFAEQGVIPEGVATPSLELGEVIGEGGMGVVYVATQTVMGRHVAVKAVRPALRDPRRTLKLLQEAWIAGRLEHPNIVPVYDIATDEHGEPLIVLKRIEGETWSHLLADPAGVSERYGVFDVLEWHLQIFIQVCTAIHFAHDRGIIHLDIKPENVMVGRHGELYVVDWGIAMALADDGTGRLPVAAACAEVVGTPHYMAPEMLAGQGAGLSTATDVFLLGATLYELIAGEPPHRGTNLLEVMHAALTNEPAFGEDASTELVAICRIAMASDPAQRYPSAEALRREIQSFLRHRESGRLAELANERLGALQRSLTGPDADGPGARELFGQVRFGFEQALASWPGNVAARTGLSRAMRRMIEHELDHGDPKVAAALAREPPEIPDELAARVAAAVAAERANLDTLKKLGREFDPNIGIRTRRFVLGIVASMWTIGPALAHFDVMRPGPTYLDLAIPALASLAFLLGLVWWARDSLSRTRINRIAMLTAIFSIGSEPLMMLGAMLVEVPPAKAFVMMSLVWAALMGLVALAFERRMLWISAAYLVCFYVSAAWIEWRYLALSATHVVFGIVISSIWRTPRPDAQPDDEPG